MRKTRCATRRRRGRSRKGSSYRGGGNIGPIGGHTTAVFTFGRFQPPHAGHASIVSAVTAAAAELGGDGYVFASSSQNKPAHLASAKHVAMVALGTYETCGANENPLSVAQKIHFLEKMNPAAIATGTRFIDTTVCGCPNIFDVITKLKEVGYTSLVMLVGNDRVADFKGMFKRAKVEGVAVQAAGEKRNGSRASGVRSFSGTKVRMAAVAGDVGTVRAATMIGDMTEADVMELINIIRVALCYPPLNP